MSINDHQQKKIQAWLIAEERKCPICNAGAENLLPVDIYEAFPPDAASGKGIDTSETIQNAKIVCQNKECNFEGVCINLEEMGLY